MQESCHRLWPIANLANYDGVEVFEMESDDEPADEASLTTTANPPVTSSKQTQQIDETTAATSVKRSSDSQPLDLTKKIR